jgi:CHAT domain-containing protein
MRMSGDTDGARQALNRALARSITVRDGRVTSIIRLQAQIMGESALVHETRNDLGAAESDLRAAITLLEREYPETMALAAARSKLAAFLARHNRNDVALTTYREVISGLVAARRQLSGVYNQMAPYFTMLVDNQTRDPAAAAEFFAATQLLVRPGVADTQAQLARELAAGDSEAAGLFRQTNNLTRDIERARIELARLSALGDGEGVVALRTETAARIANYGQQQTEMLSRLSAFPQYRAVSQDSISLSELQATLRHDEGYLKLSLVADAIYGILVTRDGAQAWRSSMTRGELDNAVDRLRQTISALDGGEYTTYPFDAEASAELYAKLFGDVAPRLPGIRHLVFEPDGAMLRLPIGLLIVDPASVTSYRARVNGGGDPFDMRGVAWLAKTSRSSTSVSPVAFRNTRNAPASRAGNAYAGFGSNTPPSTAIFAARTDGDATADSGCAWSFDTWNHPIAAAELQNAQRLLGQQGTEIVTGNGFTDQAIMGMGDLNNYRILHFATHGLVTPPRPECVVKPALLTSFGDAQSDGLLSFDEIFALRLDADLVILSACDTAGQASIAATRAAGVTTGGGSALDGLVRAFIGAGSRSVLASHWPAPDDYNATGRLISSLFEAAAGTSIADALGAAQDSLIAEADTSHPYYWAGFAIVGDGGQQLHRTGQAAPVAAATPVAPTAAASAGE